MTTAEIPDSATITQLRQATAGLLWISESDYPFEVIAWESGVQMTPEGLFPELSDANVETIPLADFFVGAIAVEDWYEAEELAQVDRYQRLLHTIKSSLTEVQVFRLGEVDISVYIVGKTLDGDIVGLKTHVIET